MHSLLVMALAAVGVSGGPVVVAEAPGGAVSDQGSWYAVKAVAAGPRSQELAALAIYDARPGAPEDRPLGIFSLQVLDAGTPRLEGSRAITFRPYGWDEHPVEGGLSANLSVLCVGRNAFYVTLAVSGAASPLSVSAVLEGTGAASATSTGVALRLDDGFGQPFGLYVGSREPGSGPVPTEGPSFRWQLTYGVPADGKIGFALVFDDSVSEAANQGAQVAILTAPDAWLGPVQMDWAAYEDSFPSPGAVPPAWAEADRAAKATLRMNRNVRGGRLGIARSKTAADHYYLLDTPIAALALSETSPADAFAALDPLLVGQVPESAGAEAGLIHNHVDESGAAPSIGDPLATDAYSAPPVLPVVLRALWERSAQDAAAQDSLDRAWRASAALHDWWLRRRDQDANGLVEANGALEAEMPDSPRFSLWGSTANLPVPDSTPRARLDVADLNAWLQWSELELWRTGEALGRDDALAWLDLGNARAARLDDAARGFWDDAQGAWVDYALDSSQAKVPRGPRTPSSFWPLATGTERDATRVRRAVAALTDPAQLWTAHGVASMSAAEIGFAQGQPWQGAVSPWQTYFVLQGLFRYGFEDEAETLRTRLLDTIAARPAMFAHYGAFSGEGLESAGSSTTAAVFIEALRRRYEEETFALSGGSAPTAREGQIRRMLRFSDGVVLAEVSVSGTRELPKTRFAATTEIFSGDPMTITFTDPTGAVTGRDITASFPALDQADVEIDRADGSMQTISLKGAPITVTAAVDDTVRLRSYHFTGERACGCVAGEGAPLGMVAVLIARAMASRKGRRTGRRATSASQRGRRCL